MNKIDQDNYSFDISLDENGNGEFIIFDKITQKIKEKTLYKNNKKNGISITYFYENGKNGRVETTFIDDKIHGSVLYYSDNLIFREENFVNDKKEGITKDYKIINGKQILWVETPYQNGQKNGVSIEYDEDGKTIKNKTEWLEGKQIADK